MARDFEDHCWKDIVTPEILETYTSYRRDLHIGARPAVLAIDLYNVVYRGGARPPHELAATHPNSCGEYAWAAVEPTQRLLAAARAAGVPIFYTKTARTPGRIKATARRRGAEIDADAFEIHEAFQPAPEDVVIAKERASGFFGTPLIAHLVRGGFDSLVVCGESTSGCVRASVVDAFSYGYHCVIVEECVFDRSLLSHKVNLFDLHHKYADVMGLDEVLAHLETIRGKEAAVA